MPNKVLYCIRHGFAVHNAMYNQIGTKAFTDYYDTPLLHEGYMQADFLSKNWPQIKDIELVIVSPLLRTLQTCATVFSETGVPIVALDSLMEFPFGADENCNKRKTKSFLVSNIPNVNFDTISEYPEWNATRSTIDDLEARRCEFVEYLNSRHETHIAVVSHSSWLNYFLYKDTEFKKELDHCIPYIYLYAC